MSRTGLPLPRLQDRPSQRHYSRPPQGSRQGRCWLCRTRQRISRPLKEVGLRSQLQISRRHHVRLIESSLRFGVRPVQPGRRILRLHQIKRTGKLTHNLGDQKYRMAGRDDFPTLAQEPPRMEKNYHTLLAPQ